MDPQRRHPGSGRVNQPFRKSGERTPGAFLPHAKQLLRPASDARLGSPPWESFPLIRASRSS